MEGAKPGERERAEGRALERSWGAASGASGSNDCLCRVSQRWFLVRHPGVVICPKFVRRGSLCNYLP